MQQILPPPGYGFELVGGRLRTVQAVSPTDIDPEPIDDSEAERAEVLIKVLEWVVRSRSLAVIGRRTVTLLHLVDRASLSSLSRVFGGSRASYCKILLDFRKNFDRDPRAKRRSS